MVRTPGSHEQSRIQGEETINWVPSKHEALSHCCYTVGPASQTMSQHYSNSGTTPCVCWVSARRSQLFIFGHLDSEVLDVRYELLLRFPRQVNKNVFF